MEGVNTTVSTLRAPSIVAAVKDLYWRMTAFDVKMLLNVQLVSTTVPEMQYAWRKWDSSDVCVLQVTKLMKILMQVVKISMSVKRVCQAAVSCVTIQLEATFVPV